MQAMRLHDVDLMDDVFTPDAVIDYTAIGGSRKASWAGDEGLAAGDDRNVEHFILFVGDVYPTFADDGRRRRSRARGTACSSPTPARPPLIVFGTYDDEFVRTADGWRIADRTDYPKIQVPTGAGQ